MLKEFYEYINLPNKSEISHSACHLFIISINYKKLDSNKDRFIKFMNKHNILLKLNLAFIKTYKLSLLKIP